MRPVVPKGPNVVRRHHCPANAQSISDRPRSVADVLSAARRGDRLAQSVLDRAGEMFAMGLSNLINLFDPQLIVLSGAQIAFDHLYEERVLESVKRSVVEVDAPLPEIKVHHWGDLMWAKGAAAYALEEIVRITIDQLNTSNPA